MSDLSPADIRAVTETLSRFTAYLRGTPDPLHALALAEPLLHEDTGVPTQLGDILRTLSRIIRAHPDTPCPYRLYDHTEALRNAAWEQTDQYALHYTLDGIRTLLAAPACVPTEHCRCR
ncbi:hypothetical protein ACIO3O_08475 [Streptomyces sp. NPDC087440]|uniref:hypothetical protein n=1 Tax=Streptomyces sp. NPDC087440 TaxID=3365790 RepID=UPI003829E4B3